MIHIGFTGTQRGMTEAQYAAVSTLVRQFKAAGATAAHHGDCVGADRAFHKIARAYGLSVFIHPCDIETKRAHCPADVVRSVKKPLDRNRDIVAESEVMIATPKECAMQIRSGTWTTVRYALKAGKPVAIVLPDGGVVYDGAPWPDGAAKGEVPWPM